MYYKLAAFLTVLLSFGLFGISPKEPGDISTIAFGSCNRQDAAQPMWSFITANKPDLWIWLGDNIYGDTDNMHELREKYVLQKQNPEYQKLLKACPIIGIWDDHDYGRNDAGKGYPYKVESQKLMLEFLDEPKASNRWKRQGAYTSYVQGSGAKEIKVILLDGRYHRDTLTKTQNGYLPNLAGDLLGEEQWEWLEKELKESKAAVNIIGCGIQFIPEEHPHEKWANYPQARKRLFTLIEKTGAKGVILLSGDRHISEISKYSGPELKQPVYEVTASGLTHAATKNTSEANQYRTGKLVNVLNFGLMEIDWSKSPLEVTLQIKGIDNKVLDSQRVLLNP